MIIEPRPCHSHSPELSPALPSANTPTGSFPLGVRPFSAKTLSCSSLWSRHEAHVTVEPFYKGMGPLSLIQWSLSTRDKLGVGPLSLIQWSLSTRDKLGMGPLSLYSGASLQGTSWGWVLCPYTVEPLYKGQVGGGSFVLYRVQGIEGLSEVTKCIITMGVEMRILEYGMCFYIKHITCTPNSYSI